MIRKPETIGYWRGRLPHWEVEEGRYFVTIHLHGAIPADGVARIERMAQEVNRQCDQKSADSSLSLMRTVFRDMEQWLDRADRNSLLAEERIASMVMEAIRFRETEGRWIVYEFVLMPSHLHLFLSVLKETLKESIEDFKRWTGHQAAKLVDLPDGRFWQDEWFDHWSRSAEQDERIVRYIQQNPVVAGLVNNWQEWKYRK